MESPWPLLLLASFYLMFCLRLGPAFMKGREPFKLRKTIILYNIYQIVANGYLFIEGGRMAWFGKYSFICQPVDRSNSGEALLAVRFCYIFLITRIVDYLDTVFFVLTKKFTNISNLHLIHHILTTVGVWYGIRITPGGHGTFMGFVNSLVHVFMYSYYLLAALGPYFQKFLWWKRYLTIAQILQFFVIFLHESAALLVGCDYPRGINVIIMILAMLLVVLFSNFYYHAYLKKGGRIQVSKKTNGHTVNGHSLSTNSHSKLTNDINGNAKITLRHKNGI